MKQVAYARGMMAALALGALVFGQAGCGGGGPANGTPGAGGAAGGAPSAGPDAGGSGGRGNPAPSPDAASGADRNATNPPPPGTAPDGGAGNGGQPDAAGGGSTTGDAAPPAPDAAPLPAVWTELTAATISLQGGVASGPGGRGSTGGTVRVAARQDIVLDPALAAPAAPAVAAVPGDAVTVTAADLGGDLVTPRSARVGDLTSAGPQRVRGISASAGDLFVEGSLRAADLGGTRQALDLSAPAGTVYITGTVDASGAPGTGQAGGAINISALRVVITGRLISSGGHSDGTAGAAGLIRISAGQTVVVSGGIDAAGGDAVGMGPVAGGAAAIVTLEAGGDLTLAGRVRIRGGAAVSRGSEAKGGAAGTLNVAAAGALRIGGVIDARGGLVEAAGGGIAAGSAGQLVVGDANRLPATVSISSPVQASGGDGPAAGGVGGSFTAQPETGSVIVRGARAIDVSGGGSGAAPGSGGEVFLSARQESSSGGVEVTGEIFSDGGSTLAGGSGPGGEAGRIHLELIPIRGPIRIGATGKLSAVGGRSGGAAPAGGGGHVTLFTNDGDLTVAGTIQVMGGEAPGDGGRGGLGGAVILWSDQNGNGDQNNLGNLLIAPTGLVDASGGNGAIGGSARNDGITDSVAEFPTDQEKIAILVDCDNVHGPTLNWLDNQGKLVARGGAHNGSGGDIMFHGIMPNGDEPVSGNIDIAGNGTGIQGDFGSE